MSLPCIYCGGNRIDCCNTMKVGNSKTLYYKLEVLVEISPDVHSQWSEHSDVDFCLARYVNGSAHLASHTDITQEYYEDHRYDTFTEEGGI